jgi:hypothetical protein
VAALESAKHIQVEDVTEERLSSPMPPGSTRVQRLATAGTRSKGCQSPEVGNANAGTADNVTDNGANSPRAQQHVRVQLLVPRAKMGLLIGSQGKTIRELLQEVFFCCSFFCSLQARAFVSCYRKPPDEKCSLQCLYLYRVFILYIY